MKNQKRWIEILILCFLAFLLSLAGCGSNSAESDKAPLKSSDITQTEEPKKEVEVTETAKPKEPVADLSPEIVFTDTQDNVFISSESADLYKQPSKEAEIMDTVPQSKLIQRTGIADDWSRLLYEDKQCYILNEFITTDIPGADESTDTELENGKIVIIDPGHQGHGDSTQEPIGPGASATKGRVTSGTSGCVSGWDEYELNLTVSLQLRDELVNRGYTVYMTRETHDINISNMERAQFAAEHNGDILVRIHANGSDDSSVNGALCMAPSQDNPFLSADLITLSQQLSQSVIDSYVAATEFHSQGVYITDEMSGINWSTMPVTIVEMGYMSNPSDDALMADASMEVKMVTGIANGIDNYFSR